MLLTTMEEEVHQARSKEIDGKWFFSCWECSFEATYFPSLKRFEVTVIGNPFVRHTCYHEEQEPTIRELVNQLDFEFEEVEVEY